MSTSGGTRASSNAGKRGGGATRTPAKSKMSEDERLAAKHDIAVAKAQERLNAAYKAVDEQQHIMDFRSPDYNHERALLEIFVEGPRRELAAARRALERAQAAPRTVAERDAQKAAKAAAKAERTQRAAERQARASTRAAATAAQPPRTPKAASWPQTRNAEVRRMNESSRQWQSQHAHETEVRPSAGRGAGFQKLTPVGTADERLLDPYGPPNPTALLGIYGEHQLAAALARNPGVEAIRSAAQIVGIKPTGSRADLIARIVYKLTHGHYSADFSQH